jgi:hypothetical protein
VRTSKTRVIAAASAAAVTAAGLLTATTALASPAHAAALQQDHPSYCPAPGSPPNYLGVLDMFTGQITRVDLHGRALHPQGLVFVGNGSSSAPSLPAGL